MNLLLAGQHLLSIGISCVILFSKRNNNNKLQRTNSTTNYNASSTDGVVVVDKDGTAGMLVEPNILICGGGPAGLLASILLNNIGIKSTILETSAKRDVWNARSYTINLNERGQQALDRGGCLEAVHHVGKVRNFIYVIDGQTGEKRSWPTATAGIALSRPMLVKQLEILASKLPRVTIKRGANVSNITIDPDSGMPSAHLEDGTVLRATHVIGADGLGSNVRASFPLFQSQSRIETCSGFSVILKAPKMPKGWKDNGIYIIKPQQIDCDYRFIASPRPTGEMGIIMMCSEDILDKHPWLAPPADATSRMPCNVKSHSELSQHVQNTIQKECPGFYKAVHKGTFKSIRVNRNVTWLRYKAKKGNSYSTANGRVALIGDAAHAMTPSRGEGCNTALESAVKLVDEISLMVKQKNESSCTISSISEAFINYGFSRPNEVQPIQEMSVEATNSKNF